MAVSCAGIPPYVNGGICIEKEESAGHKAKFFQETET
jgi:hypothetical protein